MNALAIAAIACAALVIIAACAAWYLDGRPAAGRHAPRPLSRRDTRTVAFFQGLNRERRAMAALPPVPVRTVTATRAPGGPWRWEADVTWADDAQPQPFAARLWGGDARQETERLAALHFGGAS